MKNSENRTSGNQATVQSILEAMQAVITKYGLEVMQRYPDDLRIHDKAMLERMAVPGARIAWMAGHCHTHLVSLGFNPKENLNVTYLTDLAKEDRFYVLNIGHGNKFKMDEINRKSFAALSDTPVPYERNGNASNFWLYRQSVKIGHVAIDQVGTWQEPEAKATITPMRGISQHARAALGLWCSYAITEMAGTLFTRSEVSWADPIEVAQAA
jgi:hypothetical protein